MKRTTSYIVMTLILWCSLMVCPTAGAEEGGAGGNGNPNPEAPGGPRDKAILEKNFGAGLFANFDLGKKKRVKSARVAGGVVRVEEDSRAQIGFMLEAHRFISDPPEGARRKVHGPFVGVIASGESVIDAGILGYMWGWRRSGTTETLNIGLGISVAPKAQVLGDGIEEGKPLPNGETEVRLKHTTLYGFAVSVSFGF